jgi:DNA-binding NarL/FixJ family response regulator
MPARLLVAVIAALTVIANLVLAVRWPLAVAAGVAVAGVGEFAGILIRRRPAAQAALTAGSDQLSRREVEVAVLIARGLTSKEVGQRLLIKRGTVDTHVQHIYNKLNIESRPQLAIWLVEHGLHQTANDHDANTNKHK